jgi:hypothetical protein
MTATEAREQFNKQRQTSIASELTGIEQAIKVALLKGNRQAYVGGWISDEAKKELERLGYRVEKYVQYNYEETGIFW